jgi:hypothetical protein
MLVPENLADGHWQLGIPISMLLVGISVPVNLMAISVNF